MYNNFQCKVIADDLSNSLNLSPNRQTRQIKEFVMHPHYEPKGAFHGYGENNLAVIFVRIFGVFYESFRFPCVMKFNLVYF